MPKQAGIGTRVHHPTFGRGEVKEVLHRGLEFVVAFERGFQVRLRREDVSFEGNLLSRAEPPAQWPTIAELPPPPPERSTIEALRLGIVPYGQVDHFTFGRDKEIAQLKSWLGGPDGALLIIGQYGTGKTHMLEYTYAMALNESFAVARVELDMNETPFYRPKRVYGELIASFKYMDSSGRLRDFRDFMTEVGRRSYELRRDHKYLGRVVDMVRRRIDGADMWDWIEGRESALKPTLYEHGTAASIYCNILSGIGWAAVHILGLRGLVLLFDEAEVIDGLASSIQLQRGENFVKGLLMTARAAPQLLVEGIHPRHRIGQISGLRYHGRDSIRFLYKDRSHMKVIMAFTPTPALGREFLSEASLMELDQVPLHGLQDAFARICEVYEHAYQFSLAPQLHPSILERIVTSHNAGTRSFIKASVEALDLLRFHGTDNLEETLR